MWRRVLGATLRGIEGIRVQVEADSGTGLPAFHVVGRAERVVHEGRDRIRAAFRHCGLEFPPGRVTVNLAPTDLPKTGAALDLAIALAVAATRMELDPELLAGSLFLGELGLDGSLRGVRGTLALLGATRSPEPGLERAVVPAASLPEACLWPGLQTLGAGGLGEVVGWLRGGPQPVQAVPPSAPAPAPNSPDLAHVRGQDSARRALEVAAAGGHHALLIGPPGSGKTLLARCLPGILPAMDAGQALEVTRIHSAAGALPGRGLIRRPPLRAPHHTSSEAGLAGGGRPLRPGEISLAHHGVLFLDELGEFRRPVLEALRQPLEEGEVRLVRADGALRLPARFQLLAAMNPCPCGARGDPRRECVCDDGQQARYRARISGPLLDRIDLHVAVAPVAWEEMRGSGGESSACVADRVARARERQAGRYAREIWDTNAALPAGALETYCPVPEAASGLFERAVRTLGLSMRAYTRVLRVARTVADLDGSAKLATAHVAEAIGYRQLDRELRSR